MITVGITGGIGSGKSIVSRIFSALGVPIYYADNEAKSIMDHDPGIRCRLEDRFGPDIFKAGTIDRQKLAAIVFRDKDSMNFVNALIHPAVLRHFEIWAKERRDHPYVLKEAAILFETGAYRLLDKMITVTAPEELRLARIMKRDGISEERIRAIMANQWKDDQRIPYSDYIINNSETEMVIPQVLEIHNKCRASGKKNN